MNPLVRVLQAARTPEARGQRVLLLILATFILAIGDLLLTLVYTTSVGMIELNPVARLVMEHDSPWYLAVWKISTTGLGLGILWKFRRRWPAECGAWICFLALSALSVYWLNFTTLVGADLPTYIAAAEDPRWVVMTP